MHNLVKRASVALSAHDAETLEALVAEARNRPVNPAAINIAELSRAAQILSQQLGAAAMHLNLQRRTLSANTMYKANPWAR